jgi:subtilisin family serine protease
MQVQLTGGWGRGVSRRLGAALGLFLAAPSPTWAENATLPTTAVVSPLARMQVRAAQDPQLGKTRLRSLLRPRDAGGEGTVSLWVQAEGGTRALAAAGLSAEAVTPGYAWVTLPTSDLPRLWRLPGLRRVDGPRSLRTRLDRSVPLVGGKALHDLGLRGQGVMIAVVDTGIDFRSPDFRDAAGKSRIAYLIDAGTPRRGLHPELPPSNEMAVYTADDIDAVLQAEAMGKTPTLPIAQRDENGHGTHVAGIAAGNGRATAKGLPSGRYVGVAPESTLCIVKGTRAEDSFADRDIVVGVQFCADRASALGLPLVTNLSLGSLGGPHDGDSALENMLSEIIEAPRGKARLMVAAAGNSGTDDIHASGRMLDGSHDVRIEIEPATSIAGKTSVLLEIYYDAAAPHTTSGVPTLDLELRSPSGRVLRVPAGESNQGRFPGEGDAVIDNGDLSPAVASGKAPLRGGFVLLTSESATAPIKSGTWTLRLSGRTLRYDVWMSDTSPEVSARLGSYLDPDGYVEIPAAARAAISVGAYRSRLDWLRPSGAKVAYEREVDRVAPFSSAGPTRDGRFAPDILAPGEFILSSLSADAVPGTPKSVFNAAEAQDFLLADDSVHAVLRGTSQATPHVTGGLALLLQLRPDLTVAQARELLRTTGKTDLSLPSYGSRRGFGLLDLRAALTTLRGSPEERGPVSPLHSDLGTSSDRLTPSYGEATITVSPRDGRGIPLGPGHDVQIESDAGTFTGPVRYVGTASDPFGRYERTLRASGARGTVATVTARIDGMPLQRRLTLHFVADPRLIGAPLVLAGCSYLPAGLRTPAGPPLGLLLPLLGLWALTRRRRQARDRRPGPSRPLHLACGISALLASACSSGVAGAGEAPKASTPAPSDKSPAPRPRFPPGGDYFWAASEPIAALSIRISLSGQYADIYDGAALIGRSSICSGRRSHRTPSGAFTVLEKIAEHVSNRYGDYVDENEALVQPNIDALGTPPPPGSHFRGTKMPYFLRIVGGVGLHAGPLPGFPDSHGCVRFPETIAQRLFAAAEVGTPVQIDD